MSETYTNPSLLTLSTDSITTGIAVDTTTSTVSYNNNYILSYDPSSCGSWISINNRDDHPLKKLNSNVIFEEDENFLLQNNVSRIKKNKIIFNCNREKDNRIQPYELIMDLIKQKKSFSLKVKLSDILTINYSNFRFTKIENDFSFSNNLCDFSSITVRFKYDKILFENHQLSIRDSRIDKLKKIMENI